MALHPLADALNDELQRDGCPIHSLLSQRGKAIYFPSRGILGQSAQARGKAINATIGTAFEEDGSPLTLEALETLVNIPSTSFLYAPSQGNPTLREEWKGRMMEKNPGLAGKTFSLPVVTSALTHALWVSGFLFVDEGDEIIVPDLYWDNYDLLYGESFGATLRTFNTFDNGRFDVAAMETAINATAKGKKVLLLNFPNNPTGYTVTDEEALAIRDALLRAAQAGNRLVVILDDAYFGLVYEAGVFEESLFSLLCDLHPDILAIKLDGSTKEDYVWGFRVGFMTFGFAGATPARLAALESKAAGAVRASISNAPGVSQSLLLKAYQTDGYDAQKQQKYDILKRRYLRIREVLSAHPEFGESFLAMPFNSGYFMCVKLKGADPEAVRNVLLNEFDTGVIVLSGLIRLAFSSVPHDRLEQLFTNIHEAVCKVKSG